EALKEFKRALAARPSPESNYALGCASYTLGRYRLATRYLRKAVDLDVTYVGARYALALSLLQLGESVKARPELEAVADADVDEPRLRTEARRALRTGKPPAQPKFWGNCRDLKQGLISHGERRLAEAVRQDALNTVRTLSFPG
ncbi:MAG TPA: CDC27 family protein, partial [Pyrinomonadaceae bacterium]|nr:CDC27 family protein [Pyrinomonadaceae bacterium]